MNKEQLVFEKWKSHWENTSDPGPPIDSPEWYDDYVAELKSFLIGAQTIVDTGCGNGEVLTRLTTQFEKIIGIDYSPAMILSAKELIASKHIKNIDFYATNLCNIRQIIKHPVDIIYNSQVVQFLDSETLLSFFKEAKTCLKPGGQLVLLNILNKDEQDRYSIGFHKNKIGGLAYLIRILRYKAWALRQSFGKDPLLDKYSIGYWYTHDEIKTLAKQTGFNVRIENSKLTGFGYRFHAVLSQ